jgi:hypothetical protein
VIRLSTERILITKVEFGITAMLTQLGGLSSSIMAGFAVAATIFSRKIFMLNILDKLFLVKRSSAVHDSDDARGDVDPDDSKTPRGGPKTPKANPKKDRGKFALTVEEDEHFASLQNSLEG